MEKIEVLDRAEANVKSGVWAAFVVAVILPFFIHYQFLTGPFINAMLIVVTIVLGLRYGLLLSVVPSLMALAGGLLLPVMAPVVPFIIISNMMLVWLVDYFFNQDKKQSNGFIKGVVIGSLAKSFFLMLASLSVLGLLGNPKAIKLAVSAFGSVQLGTALLGGLLAYFFLKFIKRF
jgi:hypothetical protein